MHDSGFAEKNHTVGHEERGAEAVRQDSAGIPINYRDAVAGYVSQHSELGSHALLQGSICLDRQGYRQSFQCSEGVGCPFQASWP